jgi:hypothetical protein
MEIQIPGRRRRTHTESFKLAVIHACQAPGKVDPEIETAV